MPGKGDMQQKGKGKGGKSFAPMFRMGDWYCQHCNAHNYSRNVFCFKCKVSKPDWLVGRVQQTDGTWKLAEEEEDVEMEEYGSPMKSGSDDGGSVGGLTASPERSPSPMSSPGTPMPLGFAHMNSPSAYPKMSSPTMSPMARLPASPAGLDLLDTDPLISEASLTASQQAVGSQRGYVLDLEMRLIGLKGDRDRLNNEIDAMTVLLRREEESLSRLTERVHIIRNSMPESRVRNERLSPPRKKSPARTKTRSRSDSRHTVNLRSRQSMSKSTATSSSKPTGQKRDRRDEVRSFRSQERSGRDRGSKSDGSKRSRR